MNMKNDQTPSSYYFKAKHKKQSSRFFMLLDFADFLKIVMVILVVALLVFGQSVTALIALVSFGTIILILTPKADNQ